MKQVLERVLKANQLFNIFTSVRNELKLGEKGLPLSGMLAAIKDNIVTTEEPTTCSSNMLKEYTSPFNATVIDLLNSNGALVVGKTNLDEFGMGSACTHSIFGPTLNPLYTEERRVSGGSSGGSAAAVAANLVDFSLGTDTGGSVRLPASYCGVLGFKPSYGRISRWGVIAYAQSLDTVGIFSKKMDTMKRVFKVLDTHDDKDPTSLSPNTRNLIKLPKGTLTFGVVEEFNLKEISPEVQEAWHQIILDIMAMGHQVKALSLPMIKLALPAYYTLAPAEASSNLARYDGIRYGHRSPQGDTDNGVSFAPTRSEGFGKEVQRRILLGTCNLSAEAYSNHFLKAKNVRQLLCNDFDKVFKMKNVHSTIEGNPEGVDFIITPTTMTQAPLLDTFNSEDNKNPIKSYVNDVLTVPISLAGLPAISIPRKNSLNDIPSGIQLFGQFGDDYRLLDVAESLY